MIEGLVSTVIPVYNRPAMLQDAVSSVLAQTWRPIEIIIVDDGSTDDTPVMASRLRQRHPDIIRVLSQSNAGPGAARQRGLDAANGEFIQFLDSDDLLLPSKFAVQIAGLQSDPQADIAYGKAYAVNNGRRSPAPAQRTAERLRTLFPALLQERIWPTMVPLYRYTAVSRIGPWPAKRQLEDWEYDAQAGALGLWLHYDDVYVAETRNHGEPRLAHCWRTDDNALRDMANAYVAVGALAQRAGVEPAAPEMQRFARSLFWMARRVGARGLSVEARTVLDLARTLSTTGRWQLALFDLAVSVAGWRGTSVWAERLMAMAR